MYKKAIVFILIFFNVKLASAGDLQANSEDIQTLQASKETSAVFDWIENGDIKALSEAFNDNPDELNRADADGYLPLHLLVINDSELTVEEVQAKFVLIKQILTTYPTQWDQAADNGENPIQVMWIDYTAGDDLSLLRDLAIFNVLKYVESFCAGEPYGYSDMFELLYDLDTDYKKISKQIFDSNDQLIAAKKLFEMGCVKK